jgi:hypothetical protein
MWRLTGRKDEKRKAMPQFDCRLSNTSWVKCFWHSWKNGFLGDTGLT